jgi:hypothetical protein
MNGMWRALVAGLLLGGMALWLPSTALQAASVPGTDGIAVYAPAASNDNDPCLSGNPRKHKKCNFNGGVPNPGGDPSQNGDLKVELWLSANHVAANVPFTITVTGSGTPIDQVWWWTDQASLTPSDSPTNPGTVVQGCGGTNPCVLAANLIARGPGWYNFHGRVRDTSGREAQQDLPFLVTENSRN